ncbi:MAG: hypothetical protein ISR52_10200 [Rhodospirillales bacterium]|nr:hypothetical protein [Rhodospirillales bacterium]
MKHGRIIGFLLVLLGLLLAAPMPVLAGDVPLPHPVKAVKGSQCVEPVDTMRREHMNFLKHQRDDTLRGGIRGAKHSLRQCIDCHAIPDPKGASKDRTVGPFCTSCHEYAAVSIDCFQCHTAKAEDGGKQSSRWRHKAGGENLLSELRTHLQGSTKEARP